MLQYVQKIVRFHKFAAVEACLYTNHYPTLLILEIKYNFENGHNLFQGAPNGKIADVHVV